MILPLVCFKYRADVNAATRAEHRQRLGALRDMDGLLDLKVGEDVVHSARSYDTGLAITFPDRAELAAYQSNERHVPVAQFAVELCDHIVAVDFEI